MLSIVSTPIGNLKDITVRATENLRDCDAIICEDTRVTGNLLKQLDLPKKPLISFHGYSKPEKAKGLVERMQRGERMTLVSDAGTPCISDPGYTIVSLAREAQIDIEVLPGASAFLAALSLSGFPINQFLYVGFPPLKKGRQTFFASLANEDRTSVLYESVHRIKKTLEQIAETFADQPQRRLCVCRELTKMYEESLIFTVEEIPAYVDQITAKGEFVIVIDHK